MKQVTAKTYDEWDEDTQKTILEEHRYINLNYDWWVDVLEQFEQKAEEYGFINPEFEFDCNYVQGRGAVFDCDKVDWKTCVKKSDTDRFDKLLEVDDNGLLHFEIFIKRNRYANHYSHKNTRHVESTVDFIDDVDSYADTIEELEGFINDIRKDICDEALETLTESWEYLMEDEQVADTLKINEYHFLKCGKIV